jgi:hypothetical protein
LNNEFKEINSIEKDNNNNNNKKITTITSNNLSHLNRQVIKQKLKVQNISNIVGFQKSQSKTIQQHKK